MGNSISNGCRIQTAEALEKMGIPVTMVVDAAAAYAMEQADLVLLGTEVVTENGGLVSQVGTYQIAMVAKAAGKPCYAVAESYKFLRRLPLGQKDLPANAPTALHSTFREEQTNGFQVFFCGNGSGYGQISITLRQSLCGC